MRFYLQTNFRVKCSDLKQKLKNNVYQKKYGSTEKKIFSNNRHENNDGLFSLCLRVLTKKKWSGSGQT